MSNNLIASAFGVGCFTFIDPQFDEESSSLNAYASEVRSYLEKIENITNISIDGLNSTKYFPFSPAETDDFTNCPFFPCFANGSVSFDLFLPKRLQDDLGFGGLDRERSEHIRVTIDFDHSFPVCIIKPLRPTENDFKIGASDYVIVVREFLEKKQKEIESPLKFAVLGPSPFHANFRTSFSECDEMSRSFEWNVQKRAGYDDVSVEGCDPEPANLQEYVEDVVKSNLSLFYFVVYAANSFNYSEEQIMTGLRELALRFGKLGIWRRFSNPLASGNRSILFDLHFQMIEHEQLIASLVRNVQMDKDSLTGEFLSSPLLEYVDKELQALPTGIARQMSNLTALTQALETSRSNNKAIFFAAALSAIATAAVTALIQN